VKAVPLDKFFATNTEYETGERYALVIRKVGTDVAQDVTLRAGKKIGLPFKSLFAPVQRTSSNALGPLDLKDMYLVVPPETEFKFESAGSGVVRCIGEVLLLEPGERMPSQYWDRYDAMGMRGITYLEYSKSLATDEVWAAKREVEVGSVKPSTIEQYTLNNVVMASISGDTVSYGDFGLILKVDSVPVEYLSAPGGKDGVDVLSCPRPPNATDGEIPFTLADKPVVVKGDHTLSVVVKNISGTDKAPASGSAWSVTVTLVVEYLRRE